MNYRYQLPYHIKCSNGDMSFHDGIRWDSDIDGKWGDDEMKTYLTRLFIKSGDNATDMEIFRTDEGIEVEWTMNYGRLSPRRCRTKLEPKGSKVGF